MPNERPPIPPPPQQERHAPAVEHAPAQEQEHNPEHASKRAARWGMFENDPDELQSYSGAYISRALVDDLYRYPLRSYRTLFWLWLTTGLVGGHRYYLDHIRVGALMTISYGLGGILWLLDGFRLRRMLNAYNSQQMHRRTLGQPPLEMDYLPSVEPEALEQRPTWAKEGLLSGTALVFDAIAVMLVSYILGIYTYESGAWEPITAIITMLILYNLSELLLPLRRFRLVQELLQWDYKLRLYYHYNRPPTAGGVLFKPLTAFFSIFTLPRRKLGEIRLYLEAGLFFSLLYHLFTLINGQFFTLVADLDFLTAAQEWLISLITAFAIIFAAAAPVGATLVKHSLVHTPRRDRLVLSILIGLCLYWGVTA